MAAAALVYQRKSWANLGNMASKIGAGGHGVPKWRRQQAHLAKASSLGELAAAAAMASWPGISGNRQQGRRTCGIAANRK